MEDGERGDMKCLKHRKCFVCKRHIPRTHRHHNVWRDGKHEEGVCEGCVD